MTRLKRELITAYNDSRYNKDRDLLCRAPFSNIYFNVIGQAAACWLTFANAPRYPEKSLHDIWFGEYFEGLRNCIREADLTSRCGVCEQNIKRHLFQNTLARAYDNDHTLTRYPLIMEFELSNTCNLGCTMCNGRLSSTIRAKRDGLKPHASPYDAAFVTQLEEFIPHLKEARFNGGEPFLQKICWQIWERIISLNSAVEITIATNGTIWTDKVADILSRGRFRINLSLDGMSRETYESIRVGSNYDKVMENIHKFGAYCRDRGTFFSLMINPMRTNWRELPLFIEFCNRHSYHLAFNTVYRPFHLALWTLPSQELVSIHKALSGIQFEAPFDGNEQKYRNLVDIQILTWAQEQQRREQTGGDYVTEQSLRLQAKDEFSAKLIGAYLDQAALDKATEKLRLLEQKVAKNVNEADFYSILHEAPIEWLKHDFENKNLDELAEAIYYKSKYY